MQELENILEEIKEMLEDNKVFDLNSDGTLDKCIIDVQLAWNDIKDIIRKHMNDGWTLVEERLPEDNIEVLITYADMENEKETDIAITTYGYATLGGKKLPFKEWRSPFLYFRGNYRIIAWRPLPKPYRPERSEE